MTTIRRFALIEAMLLLLILLAGATATATEARYRTQRRASDTARVARPVLRVTPLTDPPELDWLMPGTNADFLFAVVNASEAEGVSEVGLDYHLAVEWDACELPLSMSLEWLDSAGNAHTLEPAEDGAFSGPKPFGTAASSQRYRLRVGLPENAELAATPQAINVQVFVTAWQLDQSGPD